MPHLLCGFQLGNCTTLACVMQPLFDDSCGIGTLISRPRKVTTFRGLFLSAALPSA